FTAGHLSDLLPPGGPLSPSLGCMQDQKRGPDPYFPNQPPLTTLSPRSLMPGMPTSQFSRPHMAYQSETPSGSAASNNANVRPTPLAISAVESITDVTRNDLLFSLSHTPRFGQ